MPETRDKTAREFQIKCRVKETEKKRIDRAARKADMSREEFMRRAVLAAARTEKEKTMERRILEGCDALWEIVRMLDKAEKDGRLEGDHLEAIRAAFVDCRERFSEAKIAYCQSRM